MAFHHNFKMLFLLYTILLLLHLARPGISQSEPVSSPSPEPSSASSPSPDAPTPSPSSAPLQGPPPGPSPSSGSSPGPSPSSVPSPSSGPSPGPSPSSGPSPGPSKSSSGPAPGPSKSSGQAPVSSPSSGPSPGPSPTEGKAAEGPSEFDADAEGPSEHDADFELEFPPTLSPSAAVDPDVKKICDSTDHPSLCLSTIVPLLNGKTDIPSVLDVAIRAGAKIARYGLFLIQELAEDPETPPELATILNNCKASCTTAADNYEEAINALPERDTGTMNSMLSAVITNVGDCEDALLKRGTDSPFASIASRLRNITSNCLAIVSQLD